MTQFDVVIAGGAMAGATLALAIDQLAQGTLRIAVIEPHLTGSDSHPGFDSRSIALSHGTVTLLRQFGLWEAFAEHAEPIKHIHVSDQHHAGMTDIHHRDLALEALGYVVELANVGKRYQQLLEQSASIEVFCPDSVAEVVQHADHVAVTLNSGEQLEARLLVAADGAVSTCCQQLGLTLTEHDFNQTAVIANIVASEAHQGRAFERFTPSGPVALLPMSDNRISLVWCLPPEQAREVMTLSDDAFLQQLQQAFGWRLGAFTRVGCRASYPLLLRHRERHVAHRFAVVGNAAQTLHPIAGQGFNLGIRDVASLAEEIAANLNDVGDYAVLARYRQRRMQDKTHTMMMTTSLVHLFSNDVLPLKVGRNVGLAVMDTLPLFKTPLLRQTLGLITR